MTDGNYTYVAYALRISSPVRLQGLRRADGNPDVTIEYGDIDTDANGGSGDDVIRLPFEGVGTFEIHDGRRIVIDSVGEISDTALRPYLIGPTMGAVLYQRGYLVLHASSVSIRDAAVVFLGASGAGKSTIAAACQSRGHEVLSDDITAVGIDDGTPVAIPGPPLLKLTAEASGAFDFGFERLSVGPENKTIYRVRDSPRSRLPVERLYVIADGDLRTAKLSPGESIQVLVGHTYTQSLLDSASIGDHFRQCVRVADSAEVRRLFRPRDFESLSTTVQRIEREVGR